MNTRSCRVLLVLDHAPDYREEFLAELATRCRLTVLAQPCRMDGLTEPGKRSDYEYIPGLTRKFGPLRWMPGFSQILHSEQWDVLCVALNFRHPWRFIPFLLSPGLRRRWLWWGHVYGRNESSLLAAIRRWFLKRGAGVLVYSEEIAARLSNESASIKALSFNNTHSRKGDYVSAPLRDDGGSEARFLFVGRPQERKRLHVLVDMARRRPDVRVRLVGPSMESFAAEHLGGVPDNVELFGAAHGKELTNHFEWCDMVANPGHIGLLAVNAAEHGRAVAVQEGVTHAPEVALAREAGQVFLDFEDSERVDRLIETIKGNRRWLKDLSARIAEIGREKYTIEYMVEKHLEAFGAAVMGGGLTPECNSGKDTGKRQTVA